MLFYTIYQTDGVLVNVYPKKIILGESELVLYQNYGRCLSHIMLLLFDNLTDVIVKVMKTAAQTPIHV